MAGDGDVLRVLAGGEWARKLKWPPRGPPTTSWDGVQEVENGRVNKLWLGGKQLTGEIPKELGNLANLTRLDLDSNQLTGSIPAELGQLQKLERLWLNNNLLSGSIPSELGRLTNLTTLYLDNNQLSGRIPAELGQLQKLERLWLNNNLLSGGIPPELGNLAKLTYLSLRGNQLTGNIPPELGTLTGLKKLYLFDNKLEGSIPKELGNLTNLRELYLWDNQLTRRKLSRSEVNQWDEKVSPLTTLELGKKYEIRAGVSFVAMDYGLRLDVPASSNASGHIVLEDAPCDIQGFSKGCFLAPLLRGDGSIRFDKGAPARLTYELSCSFFHRQEAEEAEEYIRTHFCIKTASSADSKEPWEELRSHVARGSSSGVWELQADIHHFCVVTLTHSDKTHDAAMESADCITVDVRTARSALYFCNPSSKERLVVVKARVAAMGVHEHGAAGANPTGVGVTGSRKKRNEATADEIYHGLKHLPAMEYRNAAGPRKFWWHNLFFWRKGPEGVYIHSCKITLEEAGHRAGLGATSFYLELEKKTGGKLDVDVYPIGMVHGGYSYILPGQPRSMVKVNGIEDEEKDSSGTEIVEGYKILVEKVVSHRRVCNLW